MRMLGKEVTPEKLLQFASMKWEQKRKQARVLRKPIMWVTHPLELHQRRSAGQGMSLPAALAPKRQTLHDTGYVPVDDLMDKSLLAELQEVAAARLAHENATGDARRIGSKQYWSQLLRQEDRAASSIFVRFALQKPILQVVTALFGQVPHLTILELALTRSMEEPRGPVASQRWHYDLGDSRTIKLFVYLTDVRDDDEGPFIFIPHDPRRPRLPWYPVHKTDALVAPTGLLERKMTVYGKAGTSFLIDTYNCLHCGSRLAPGHQRLAAIITYNTFCSWIPYDNRVAVDRALDPLERMVLRV
jgi:hypothetical protein